MFPVAHRAASPGTPSAIFVASVSVASRTLVPFKYPRSVYPTISTRNVSPGCGVTVAGANANTRVCALGTPSYLKLQSP